MSDIQMDELLDKAIAQTRQAEPDPQVVEAAAARVWERLSGAGAAAASTAAEVTEIQSCDDYQALIPAYLAGSLSQSRKLLLEEHTRECIPCRRALKDAREGRVPAQTADHTVKPKRHGLSASVKRWAVAALLTLGVGAGLYVISDDLLYGGLSATVQTADAEIFKVTEHSQLALTNGDKILEGDVIRTSRAGGAVLLLEDGSRIEMRERSEIVLDESRRGTTVGLHRGNVIVEAAEQRGRGLYVSTEDCLVSVKGTIFSVNHGVKGSRVAVVEGEVRVNHAGEETVLLPGEQVTTNDYLSAVAVEREIGWSRDSERYVQMLQEFAELRKAIREQVPAPGLRYESNLLELVPDDTVIFVAVPNLGETITKTYDVVKDRMDQSPILQEWWQQESLGQELEPLIEQAVTRLGQFSEYLGDEVVVASRAPTADNFKLPLVMGDLTDKAGLRQFLDDLGAEIGSIVYHSSFDGAVAFIDDPFGEIPADAEVYIWMTEELVAVGTPDQLREVAGFVMRGEANPFVDSDFYRHLNALYEDGAEILVAADMKKAIRTLKQVADITGDQGVVERLGVLDVEHLVYEQKHLDKTYHRAVLTFDDVDHGVASWLAEPAPMGALDFLSRDSSLVVAFVIKDPVALLDDIGAISTEGEDGLAHVIAEVEERFGFNLRDDLVSVLGGEIAFALDGPVVPTPAWKLIIEVYDPARFQYVLEQSLAEVNVLLAQQGQEPLEISSEVSGGRTYYSLPFEAEGLPISIYYTFADGYLLMGPSRAVLDQAIRSRESGFGLTDSAKFSDLMPTDTQVNFSAMLYQDLFRLVNDSVEALGRAALTEEQRKAVEALTADRGPTLGYAYGGDDRIVFAASTDGAVMSMIFEHMIGLRSPLDLAETLQLPGFLGSI